MSVWTEVDATISIPKNSHFSVKKAIYEQWPDECFTKVEQKIVGNYVVNTVKFNFCDDGMSAANSLQKFVDNIRENVKTPYIEVLATIRF